MTVGKPHRGWCTGNPAASVGTRRSHHVSPGRDTPRHWAPDETRTAPPGSWNWGAPLEPLECGPGWWSQCPGWAPPVTAGHWSTAPQDSGAAPSFWPSAGLPAVYVRSRLLGPGDTGDMPGGVCGGASVLGPRSGEAVQLLTRRNPEAPPLRGACPRFSPYLSGCLRDGPVPASCQVCCRGPAAGRCPLTFLAVRWAESGFVVTAVAGLISLFLRGKGSLRSIQETHHH